MGSRPSLFRARPVPLGVDPPGARPVPLRTVLGPPGGPSPITSYCEQCFAPAQPGSNYCRAHAMYDRPICEHCDRPASVILNGYTVSSAPECVRWATHA